MGEKEASDSDILEEASLRKTVRKALMKIDFANVEESIDLIFAHLENTNRLQRGEVVGIGNSRISMIRVADIGKTFASQEIPVQEMAPFRLKEMIRILDKDIAEKSAKVQELNA